MKALSKRFEKKITNTRDDTFKDLGTYLNASIDVRGLEVFEGSRQYSAQRVDALEEVLRKTKVQPRSPNFAMDVIVQCTEEEVKAALIYDTESDTFVLNTAIIKARILNGVTRKFALEKLLSNPPEAHYPGKVVQYSDYLWRCRLWICKQI